MSEQAIWKRIVSTSELRTGEIYRYRKTKALVRLVTIDKSGLKRHSTVRLVVEQVCSPYIRIILRAPSALERDAAQ